jgi:hypothetical protein
MSRGSLEFDEDAGSGANGIFGAESRCFAGSNTPGYGITVSRVGPKTFQAIHS